MNMKSSPSLYVVAAPSGGGKTSLVQALLERDDQVSLSVSHTTRSPRPGEEHGVHYHFVTDHAFMALIDQDDFLEHAQVYDHRYGTGRSSVEEKLAQGLDVLLDIDWQGARQVRSAYPDAVLIFIIPPSIEALRKRLNARGQDSDEVIARRMSKAQSEISHWEEFDHVIVNDDFNAALDDLHAIIRKGAPLRSFDDQKTAEILANLLKNG